MPTHGDDLDDDFVLDVDDIVALSENEAEDTLPQNLDRDSASIGGSPVPEQGSKRKRKGQTKEPRAKKIKLEQPASQPREDRLLASQTAQQLSIYLASKQATTFSKLSALELEDLRIPDSSIADTTQWTGPRNLDNLVDFICKTLPTLRTRLGQKSKANGSPTLLFVSSAALRVADATRVLKSKTLRGEKGGEVAKLFAKHIKLSDHINYLRRTKVGAAAGTPGRIGSLLKESGALSVTALTHIIFDLSFRDAKERNLFDIPETRDEIFKTILSSSQIMKGIQSGKIQLVMF
ncbi:U3-containing 90S pre-ribosomal complex subunit-domain containing protein [Flagelloscypha sp. PMI_526]|nr:U3-containing 90S pre-ribosomal complex subunit-domain containing protein [Flagelloscypha sp. PMI_526]